MEERRVNVFRDQNTWSPEFRKGVQAAAMLAAMRVIEKSQDDWVWEEWTGE